MAKFETCGQILLDVKMTRNHTPRDRIHSQPSTPLLTIPSGGSVILFDAPTFALKSVLSPNELKQRVEEAAARHQKEIKFVPSSRGNEQKLIDCLRELKTWNDKYRSEFSER